MDENQKPQEPIISTPLSNNQIEQVSMQKPSKGRYFFIVLGVLQTLGITIYLFLWIWSLLLAKQGTSGMEFVDTLVLIIFVPAVGIVALINLIGLPIYMVKHKPRGKGLVFSILSLLISFGVFLFVAYGVYQIQLIHEISRKESEERAQQFREYNGNQETPKPAKLY